MSCIVQIKSYVLFTILFTFVFAGSSFAKNHQVLRLDSDTHFDLLNVNGGQLFVQTGDGSGGINAPSLIPLDFTPEIIETGDIDADGLTDLIAVADDGELSVSLNDGLGSFADEVPITIGLGVGETVADVAVGLLNNDSFLDVAVVINGAVSSRAVILENDGMGGFSPFLGINLLSVLGNAVTIEIGDFNQDGFGDLLVNDLLGVLHSVLSDGLGGHETPDVSVVGLPIDGMVYFKDMNQDGSMDLIVLDKVLGLLTVRLGNGDGTFATGTSISVGLLPSDLVAVDINHDGFNDVIVINVGDNTATVLLSDGLGGLVVAVGQVLDDLMGVIGGLGAALPIAVVSADFNGDCRYDMAVWSDLTDEYIVTINQDGPDLNDLLFCSRFEDMSAN